MRRILVEAARRKSSQRGGGKLRRNELLDDDLLVSPVDYDEILDLDGALDRLSAVDARAAELVKLRVFTGMTIDEVAQFQGVSPSTAKRTWAYARAWIGRELDDHIDRDR